MYFRFNCLERPSRKVIFLTLFLLSFMNLAIAPATLEAAKDETKYVVWVSNKRKFVWFRVAKVGSTTIKNILLRPNMSIISDHFSFNPHKYRDYFKFAFVRNPWDRVVSCYCQKVENKNPDWKHYYGECFDKGFDYFIDFINQKDLRTADKHIRLQTALVPVNECDFIGRLENFEADLRYVLEVIGVDVKKIPKKNPSKHAHYSHYYNEQTKEIIASKYKDDIETFGYTFEVQ